MIAALCGRGSSGSRATRWPTSIEATRVAQRALISTPPRGAASADQALEARSLWQWIEQVVPERADARETLRWLAREADGDKLEAIAREHALPPARVRQRVSRMRRLIRSRFLVEIAAAAALLAAALLLWRWPRAPRETARRMHLDPPRVELPAPPPAPPEPTPLERAATLREYATPLCTGFFWAECLSMLDEAARLDPAGDRAADVQLARAKARASRAEERRRPSRFGTP